MTRTLLLLALMLVPAPAAAAQQPGSPPDFDTLFAQAMALHQAGDIVGAIDAYMAALDLQPDRADARSNLGAAYVRLGRFDEAVEQYRLAIQIDPSNSAFRFNLGLAYYKAARHPEAIRELEAVAAARPEHKPAVLLLGDALLHAGEFQKVIDLLVVRQAEFTEDLAFGYILGTALIRTGRPDEAQVYLDRIFSAGESAEAHLLMGTAFIEARDYPAAVAELRKALELNPGLPTARTVFGRALLGAGDHDGAVREFQRALQANPNDFEANLQLGALLRRDQRHDDALIYLLRAVRLRPADPIARFALAGTQLALGNVEQASTLLEQVVAEVPEYTEAHVMLATCYYRLKRNEDGDRHRAIAERLRHERQEREPTAETHPGPARAAPPGSPEAS